MCGGNLYNILLRQELEKKNRVKPENEQAKINGITSSNQHFIIKAIRKFGRTFQTQYVQYSEHNNDGTIDDPIKSDKETEETTITTNQVF
jgi:hypothetical protein